MGLKKSAVCFVACLMAICAHASDPAFKVGPNDRCGTDFQPGQPSSCAKATATLAIQPAQSAASAPRPAAPRVATAPKSPNSAPTSSTSTTTVGGVSEEDVSKYLESHGKPSREAVRAVLNPTDENIASMRRKHSADLAIAAYIANRSGQLDAPTSGGLRVEPLAAGEAPLLNRMRVTLYTALNCAACDKSINSVQTLLVQAPMMEIQVAVTGQVPEREILLTMAKLGLTLPIRQADAQEMQRLKRSAPFMHIVDVKNQREGVLPVSTDTEAIKQAIIAFRKQGEPKSTRSEAK